MDPVSLTILIVGFTFSLSSFLLIRKWAKMKDAAYRSYRPDRRSYRADVINGALEKQALDAAVIASGIVTGSVIHS